MISALKVRKCAPYLPTFNGSSGIHGEIISAQLIVWYQRVRGSDSEALWGVIFGVFGDYKKGANLLFQ
jgi:hypothetical protein